MKLLNALRARLSLLFNRRAAELRMDDEFQFHVDMETEKNIRTGMDATEARRRAFLAFGARQHHREQMRDERGVAWLGGMSLDLRLGARMLVKYPGLTIVGGIAMAFAIWVVTVTFTMTSIFVSPTLPLPGGDRVVLVRNWDVALQREASRALYDFMAWRTSLSTITDLGAYRDAAPNLLASDGEVMPVTAAEITASAFTVAPVAPMLGRVLISADEQAGAPMVVVLGHDLWRTRFASDSGVVGRPVKLGESSATVVGVMPEGFAFPVAHHLWTALQPGALPNAPGQGPSITMFGRLADGVTQDEAQAELSAAARRSSVALRATHEHLDAQVGPYAMQFQTPSVDDQAAMYSIYVFAAMLLVLVGSNVALLLFARAAAREVELVVRSALGASRRRIIMQLFAEALVLGAVAAVIGLAFADLSLRAWGTEFLRQNYGDSMPFWYTPQLSLGAIAYAIVMTVLGAVIAGIIPARKVTKGLGTHLKESAPGAGGLRFGGVWTAVIVVQVAFTVAFPFMVYVEQSEYNRISNTDVGFADEEYLGVRLDMDGPDATGPEADARIAEHQRRFEASRMALRSRLETDPGVLGVTFVERLPRDYHREHFVMLDDSAGMAVPQGQPLHDAREVSIAAIDPSYFDVLGAPMLAGRTFATSELRPDARVVIVDQGFVDVVMKGRNPIGRRIRFDDEVQPGLAPGESPWYEIVGLVKELGIGAITQRQRAAGVYLPASPQDWTPVHMIVHLRGEPMAAIPRVRALGMDVDPSLRLVNFQRLDATHTGILWVITLWLRSTMGLTAVAILLSLAGIYSVLSFTVARRTREIGVRVALGANRQRLVLDVFRRPLMQVSLGVLGGALLVAAAALQLTAGDLTLTQVAMIVGHAVLMFGVCMLACIVPTRRALKVEPTEALRQA